MSWKEWIAAAIILVIGLVVVYRVLLFFCGRRILSEVEKNCEKDEVIRAATKTLDVAEWRSCCEDRFGRRVSLMSAGQRIYRHALDEASEQLRRLKKALSAFSGVDQDSRQLLADAQSALDQYLFTAAYPLLLELRQRNRVAMAKFQDKARQRFDAENTVALANLTKLRDFSAEAYRQAAETYAEAAQGIAVIDPEASIFYRRQQAATLVDLDFIWGDVAALHHAVSIYRELLPNIDQTRSAAVWTETQNDLSRVLYILGEKENKSEWFLEAITACRAALRVITQNEMPGGLEIRHRLGAVLRTLGEKENDEARLRESFREFRAIAQSFSLSGLAMAKSNLGDTLFLLGQQKNKLAYFRKAAAAYRSALRIYDENGVDHKSSYVVQNWKATQNNFRKVLSVLGEQESVAAFQDAVQRYCEDEEPFDLTIEGNRLRTLGEQEKSTELLTQAVMVHHIALVTCDPADEQKAQDSLDQSEAALERLEAELGRADDK